MSCIIGPNQIEALLIRYNGIGKPITSDEREILLFALHNESEAQGGIVVSANAACKRIWAREQIVGATEPVVAQPVTPESETDWCPRCDGTGIMDGWNNRDGVSCPRCKGAKTVPKRWVPSPSAIEPEPTDKNLLDWLAEQIVDVIYLDDGRIIDIKGECPRKKIRAAMREGRP